MPNTTSPTILEVIKAPRPFFISTARKAVPLPNPRSNGPNLSSQQTLILGFLRLYTLCFFSSLSFYQQLSQTQIPLSLSLQFSFRIFSRNNHGEGPRSLLGYRQESQRFILFIFLLIYFSDKLYFPIFIDIFLFR